MSSVPDNNTTLCPASLCSLIFANAISEISGTIFSLKHCSASDFINDTDFPCRYGRFDRIAMPDLSFIFLHIKTTFRSISIIVMYPRVKRYLRKTRSIEVPRTMVWSISKKAVIISSPEVLYAVSYNRYCPDYTHEYCNMNERHAGSIKGCLPIRRE